MNMRLVLLDTAKIEVYKGKGFIGVNRGGSEAESAGRKCEMPAWTQFGIGCTRGVIGASLSKLHTSGTALRRCVTIRACLLAAIYLNVRLNISRKLNVLMRLVGMVGQCWANRSGDGSSLSTHGTLLLLCHSILYHLWSQQLRTNHQRQAAR